jgi:hypothetical protein
MINRNTIKVEIIVADRDGFYYVTEKYWVSCVIGLKEYEDDRNTR